MARFVLIFLSYVVGVIAVALLVVMNPSPVTVIVAVLFDFGGVAILTASAFHLLWRPWLAAFPAREPAADAVRRRFQSFRFGFVSMGFSIHVAADDVYLHLEPLSLWQSLGARSASIPWSAMEPVGKSGRVVKAGGHQLEGPAWCMNLVSPPADDRGPSVDK